MTATFSLLSWLSRIPTAASCIDGDGRFGQWGEPHERHYYALAEDRKGSHCPYPKLPPWCQRIFDARVKAEYWWDAHYHYWQLGAEHLMLGWHWPEPYRRCIVLTMRRVDRLFYCRRRGYSWHFHCSLCGANSFFDLGGSRWACKKCGRLNPATPERRPRFSLLRLMQRWSELCRKIDNRPRWICCRWCGKTGPSNDRSGFIGSTVQNISGKKRGTTWTCFACYDPEQKITEYLQYRDGGYLDGDVKRFMRKWQRTGVLPKVIEQHWEDLCPF